MSRSGLTLAFFIFLPVLICDADIIQTPSAPSSIFLDTNIKPPKARPKIIAAGAKYDYAKTGGLMSEVSPDYRLHGRIALQRVPNTRQKRAFTFVFLMNKEKGEARKIRKQHKIVLEEMPPAQKRRMHILWTGSKKIVKEQKVIDDTYPLDVSIARYDEGFSPGEWNLVLPSKKPKEIAVSFLWSF
jgi:hypothetical protein